MLFPPFEVHDEDVPVERRAPLRAYERVAHARPVGCFFQARGASMDGEPMGFLVQVCGAKSKGWTSVLPAASL